MYESTIEANVIQLALSSREVVDIREQQGPVPYLDKNGRQKKHFFDLVITFASGRRDAQIIKPADLVTEEFKEEFRRIAGATSKSLADTVSIVTNDDYGWGDVLDARAVLRARRAPDDAADQILSDTIERLNGAVSIEQLMALSGLESRAWNAIVRALYDERLARARTERITVTTLVKRADW